VTPGAARYAAQVIQVSDSSISRPGPDSADWVVGDVRQYLRGLPGTEGRGLAIEDASRSGGSSVLGWRVPAWMAGAALVLWVLTVSLVVGGPTPWRATRWAWFWFVAGPLGFIGVPAFLALGGRLPWGMTAAPRGRVTGGWCLVAVCLFSAVIDSLRQT